jgi:hypothetical protein
MHRRYWDGSNSPCRSEFSLDNYQSAFIYEDGPGGNPTYWPYAGEETIQRLFTSTWDEGLSFLVIGGELRVVLPLTVIAPYENLEMVVSEPDGHITTALFELSQLF